MRRACTALALLLATAAAADPLDRGRHLSDLFYASDIDTLWDDFSPHLQRAFSGKAGLKAFRNKIRGDFGEEQRMFSEQVHRRPVTTYIRVGTWSRYGGAIELAWTFDAMEQATSIAVHPAATEAPSKFTAHLTMTHLRLPFHGRWHVLWGGRFVAENRHSVSADMRYAYDLLVVHNDRSYANDGSKLEDYYAWDRPILVPGDGQVVEVVNDIPDNIPGTINPSTLYGNHVIIDHHNGEFSLLAHLRQGSVVVKRGQEVHAGEALARCGSSGTSTEPHLHYQMMNGRRYLKSWGLPAQFEGYIADGKRVERGEPVRGQEIEPLDADDLSAN